jgi:hypothetical protein
MPLERPAPEKWTVGDILAAGAMQQLTTGYIPWTNWSMRPAAIASVVNEILLKPRRTVVELGAGASTLLLAGAVRQSEGQLVSVEHDAGFCASLNRLIAEHDLDKHAAVVHVPLTPLPAPGDALVSDYEIPVLWYDLRRLDQVVPAGVDLLLVDGPPAGEHGNVLIREPAVRAIRHKLGPSFSVYLDDVDRGPEQETLRLWEEQLQISFTVIQRIGIGMGSTDDGFAPTY